jgi:hypothetical protein
VRIQSGSVCNGGAGLSASLVLVERAVGDDNAHTIRVPLVLVEHGGVGGELTAREREPQVESTDDGQGNGDRDEEGDARDAGHFQLLDRIVFVCASDL